MFLPCYLLIYAYHTLCNNIIKYLYNYVFSDQMLHILTAYIFVWFKLQNFACDAHVFCACTRYVHLSSGWLYCRLIINQTSSWGMEMKKRRIGNENGGNYGNKKVSNKNAYGLSIYVIH